MAIVIIMFLLAFRLGHMDAKPSQEGQGPWTVIPRKRKSTKECIFDNCYRHVVSLRTRPQPWKHSFFKPRLIELFVLVGAQVVFHWHCHHQMMKWDYCKRPSFAWFSCQAQISILEIFNIFLRLKSSPFLVLNVSWTFCLRSRNMKDKEVNQP